MTQYKARYEAQPEVVRGRELEAVADRVWDRKWEAADELIVATPETFADLITQIEIWLDLSISRNLDGELIGMDDFANKEYTEFLIRLPDEIRRLTGGGS